MMKLTIAQRRVMNLVVQGDVNKVIAYKLGITEGTARSHIATILKVHVLANRTQLAVRYARELWEAEKAAAE